MAIPTPKAAASVGDGAAFAVEAERVANRRQAADEHLSTMSGGGYRDHGAGRELWAFLGENYGIAA